MGQGPLHREKFAFKNTGEILSTNRQEMMWSNRPQPGWAIFSFFMPLLCSLVSFVCQHSLLPPRKGCAAYALGSGSTLLLLHQPARPGRGPLSPQVPDTPNMSKCYGKHRILSLGCTKVKGDSFLAILPFGWLSSCSNKILSQPELVG